ncbi:prostaglandin reductase 2-like [Ornithodoros turicata]|uniref:prostaglandin reductase 2-like n=1 Tax=Ornithodoros turicata TaxID=34597 RepID=UPI003139DA61
MQQENKQVVFVSRPGETGKPSESNFAVESCPYPELTRDRQIIIRTIYVAIDAALRYRMNECTKEYYLSTWKINNVVPGFAGVGLVIESQFPKFHKGDYVYRFVEWPWKIFFAGVAESLHKIVIEDFLNDLTAPVNYLGVSGLSAFLGLREKGHIKRGSGQTCVVSAAAGACGSLAGQIARLEGCERVVGICGNDVKCNYLTETLKFDAAINYRTQNVEERLKQTCPKGIQVYFDNVGGAISDEVIKQMTPNANIVLNGQIAMYNTDTPHPTPLSPEIQTIVDTKNIKRDGFIVIEHENKFEAAMLQIRTWVKDGKLIPKCTIAEGIESAPKAFINMMSGGNIGKQLVRFSSP